MGLIRRIRLFVTDYLIPTKDEWHAYWTGFYYGSRQEYRVLPEALYDTESDFYQEYIDNELWYATSGFEHGDWYRNNRRKVYALLGAAIFLLIRWMVGDLNHNQLTHIGELAVELAATLT